MPQQPQQSKIAQPSEPSSEEEHGSEAYTHDEEMSQTGSDMTGSQDEDEVSSESSQGGTVDISPSYIESSIIHILFSLVGRVVLQLTGT